MTTAQAVAVTAALRHDASEHGAARIARRVGDRVHGRARVASRSPTRCSRAQACPRPGGDSVLLMVQIEVESDDARGVRAAAGRCWTRAASLTKRSIAAPDDDRGAQRLFELREAVPASVNALVAAAKARAHPDIEKTAGDMVVPFSRLAESLALYRQAFESRGLDYAIWGHVSDGNLHPNLIPRTLDDMTARPRSDPRDRPRRDRHGRRAARRARRRPQRAEAAAAARALWRRRASSRCARSSARSIRTGSSRQVCCSLVERYGADHVERTLHCCVVGRSQRGQSVARHTIRLHRSDYRLYDVKRRARRKRATRRGICAARRSASGPLLRRARARGRGPRRA